MSKIDLYSGDCLGKDIFIWWSAGATSAVSTKLALDMFGKDRCRIFYFKIHSAHMDNKRFKSECEAWYGLEIENWQSEKYRDQFEVIEKTKYVNGAQGARCTMELKRKVREKIQKLYPNWACQIFGFENSTNEIDRASRLPSELNARFPLIEKQLTKPNCLQILKNVEIDLPEMYKLGYPNNNCIGCVKGGMGYWNKIRIDFPDTFDKMSNLEQKVGRSCLKENGKPLFLKDLNPLRGRDMKPIVPDCGFFCGDTNEYI